MARVHTTQVRERAARGGGLLLLLAAVGLAALFLLVGNVFGFLDFGERTIDRSQPPLLNSLTDLSEYRAASATSRWWSISRRTRSTSPISSRASA